jgi:hypothetical protein
MQWVKANLNLVITMAVGVLGITFLVLGVLTSDVATAMQQDQTTLSNLSGAKGSNATAIEEARAYSNRVKDQLEKSLKDFESIGTHTPILDKIFPAPPPKDTSAAFKFKPAYLTALNELVTKLHGITPPSTLDYKREDELMQSERLKAEREKKLGIDPTTRPTGGRGVLRAPAPAPAPINKPVDKMTPEELAQNNSQVRASIRRAHQGYCYASLDDKASGISSSFMMPELLTSNLAPSLDQMWYAQMVLWIEQDVVNALASINDGVAAKLPEKERWVGNLPIKRIVKINVGNYLPATPPSGPSTPGAALGGASFTNRGSANGVDAIQFALDMYLNPTYLPTVITEITRSGFYTSLLVNYEAEPPSANLVGFVYGSQPVVHAIMQFEGCFLRSKFEKMMPEVVKTAIAEGRAGLSATQGPAGYTPGGFSPGNVPGPGMPGDGRFN